MTHYALISILLGAAMLCASLKPISSILKLTHNGRIRRLWAALRWMIVLFIASYTIFAGLRFGDEGTIADVVVSTILLLGGAFVLIVAYLSAVTAGDILRIARLENEVVRDPLTGVFNRRFMEGTLEVEMEKAQRDRRALSALLIDLDYFKRINDTYGHPFGDLVLKHVSALIVRQTRRTDMVVRYGGEEFLVIAPDSDLEATCHLGRRILDEIAGSTIPLPDGLSLSVTASIGASSMTLDENWDTFLSRTDQALYAAKQAGRNRIVAMPETAMLLSA